MLEERRDWAKGADSERNPYPVQCVEENDVRDGSKSSLFLF